MALEITLIDRDTLLSATDTERCASILSNAILGVFDDFYEDLNYENTKNVLQSFIDGNPSPIGSQTGRKGSRAEEYVKS